MIKDIIVCKYRICVNNEIKSEFSNVHELESYLYNNFIDNIQDSTIEILIGKEWVLHDSAEKYRSRIYEQIHNINISTLFY